MTATARLTLDEAAARRVLLVMAFETAPDGPLWTAEDRQWASRAALQAVPADAAPERYLAERATLALQRLAPRDAAVRRAEHPLLPAVWPAGVVAGAFLLGALVDPIGSSQQINLLAPPVWTLVLWNLAVYALLLGHRLRGGAAAGPVRHGLQSLRAWLGRGGAALPGFALLWARHGQPLRAARLALLLHAAAAALALGVIAGLYVRGLVLDYRGVWGSTFLDAAQVQAALSWLLAPAAAVSGRPVPVVGAPGATAAPWIHLYATTLVLFVVLPRALLAAAAALAVHRRARAVALPAADPYFQRLLRPRAGPARVVLRPHGAEPSAAALAGLRTLLAAVLGDGAQLQAEPAVAPGDEELAGAPATPGGTLQLLLVDLGATPEAEAQGRLVHTLREAAPALPLLLLADEGAFRRRFGGLPGRLDERRAAWREFARALELPLVCADLAAPDAAAEAALQQALAG